MTLSAINNDRARSELGCKYKNKWFEITLLNKLITLFGL